MGVNPTTISNLPAANTPLVGNELIPIVQNGITRNVTANAIVTQAMANSIVGGTGITVTTAAGVSTVTAKTATSSTLGIVQPDNSTITVSAGVLTAVQSGVTSFTGDGIVLSNSSSTGAVTATLESIARNLVLAGPATGSNATPTFRALVAADLPASNSALILLNTVNASAAASVTFNSTYITSTYNKYIIEFDGVYSSSNGVDLYLLVSTNNGSTYVSTNYQWAGITVPENTGTPAGEAASGDTQFNLTMTLAGIGTSAGGGFSGTIKFSNPSAAASQLFGWDIHGNTTNTFLQGSGRQTATSAINNIKLILSAGNITGNFHLYGIAGT
jgi:hypothetical protein